MKICNYNYFSDIRKNKLLNKKLPKTATRGSAQNKQQNQLRAYLVITKIIVVSNRNTKPHCYYSQTLRPHYEFLSSVRIFGQ